MAEVKIGPTGEYPEGRLDDGDRGELVLRVGADWDSGNVIIDFGAECSWIGMGPDKAIELAQLIQSRAKMLQDAQGRGAEEGGDGENKE